MSHHIAGPVCPLCDEKLEAVHAGLVDWYKTQVKAQFMDAHVSWGYRDEQSQNQAVADGKSKLRYPSSPHNQKPALAIDLFQINMDNEAVFNPGFYRAVADLAKRSDLNIIWGGTFKSLHDADHFGLANA